MKPGSPFQHSKEIAAICCHFNPARSTQRIRNYERFRKLIERGGITLLTVELAFRDQPFDLPPGRDVIRIRGGSIMWQKERLHQLGAERAIEEGFRKIAFLDSDVLFEDDDWPRRVSRALDSVPVVQCFSTAMRNFSDELFVQNSAVRNVIEMQDKPGPARGIAWAVSADIVEKVGLYQHCIVGGGDTAFAFAALGVADGGARSSRILKRPSFMRHAGNAMNDHYLSWAGRFHRATEGRCGYVDQRVFTLSHGTKVNRNYRSRHQILEGFDPEREVAVGTCGAFVWTEAGRPRAEKVRKYFLGRREGPA